MKKVRLIGQKMVSVFLMAALFVVPVNMNRCFAGEVSEKSIQETEEFLKYRQELNKKDSEEIHLGQEWLKYFKRLKKRDKDKTEKVLCFFYCVVLASNLLLVGLVGNEVWSKKASDILSRFRSFVLNATKTVWNTSKEPLLKLCGQEAKDNLAFAGAISLAYLPIKLCYSLYNAAKDLF